MATRAKTLGACGERRLAAPSYGCPCARERREAGLRSEDAPLYLLACYRIACELRRAAQVRKNCANLRRRRRYPKGTPSGVPRGGGRGSGGRELGPKGQQLSLPVFPP